jgi:hypothetical protein
MEVQQEKDSSIIDWSVWAVIVPRKNNEYKYVVATLFKEFNNYLETYINHGQLFDTASNFKKQASSQKRQMQDSIHSFIYQVLAHTSLPGHLPKYLLKTEIRTAPGKAMAYEFTEIRDWMPIHKDLIRKGYESAYNFSKLIFPLNISSPSDYMIFRFFDDEKMFDKQNNIDWQPYMKTNQSAFINSGILRTEVGAELLTLIASLKHNDTHSSGRN